MRNLNDQSFSELLGLIYEAPLQPDGWRDVLSALPDFALTTSLTWTTLQHWGSSLPSAGQPIRLSDWGPSYYASHGASPESEQAFFSHWAYQIPLTPNIIMRDLQQQAVITNHQNLVPGFDYEHSAFCQEYALPNDFYYTACASGLSRTITGAPSLFILTLNRPRRHGDFSNQEHRLLTELFPHLLRAHRIGQTMREMQLVQGLQASALDQTTAPVLGLGRNAQLLYTNKAADTLLHSEQVFRVQAGHLQALRPAEQQALLCALHRAAQIGVEIGGCPHDHLTFAREQAAPLSGTLLPVSPSHPERGFTLLLKDPATRRTPPLLLQHLFSLTPAEARVATLLTEGHSPEEIAAHLGTATATVRNQLKQVFAKTGVRRQGELIRLILNLA